LSLKEFAKMKSKRHGEVVACFTARNLSPAKIVHRHDGTVELTWHVDDCDERYVRVTSSVHGDDHVLVSRNLRVVEACVLQGCEEIFDWVSARLVGLFNSRSQRQVGPVLEGRP
jgi:hypothetical protein